MASTTNRVELALADYEAMFGHPLIDTCEVDPETGEILPVRTIVTDNGGPFRSLNFQLFIATHPELRPVRTTVRSPRPVGVPPLAGQAQGSAASGR
jgi:hypothetical protein